MPIVLSTTFFVVSIVVALLVALLDDPDRSQRYRASGTIVRAIKVDVVDRRPVQIEASVPPKSLT